MAGSASPLLQPANAHLHLDSEVCPWCEQSITHDKFEEISARIAAEEKQRLAQQESVLRDQFARERAQADVKARTDIANAQQAAAEAIAKVKEDAKAAADVQAAEAARKLEQAVSIGKAEVEAALREKLGDAEALAAKAAEDKLAAETQLKAGQEAFATQLAEAEEKRMADMAATAAATEAALAQKVTTALHEAATKITEAENAKAVAEKEAADKVAVATAAKAAAEQQVEAQKAAHANELVERLNEVRDSLGKEKTQALLDEQAKAFAERQKFNATVQDLQRQLEKKTASELGEGAEIDLFQQLKDTFEGDNIRRVKKGVNGADVIHEIVENGKVCGKIVYDSKNRNAWQSNFAVKLHADMIAEKADHAILSTNKFPAGGNQLQMYGGVILACPARVVAIAELLRTHIVQTHTLRLSNEQRDEKTAALYGYITSDRCWQLLDSMQPSVEKLEEVDVAEKKAHDAIWEKRGRLLKDVEKTRGTFVHEVNRIIGTVEAAE